MKNVPAELLYALAFAAILLVQYLMQRFARRAEPEAPQEPPLPEAPLPDIWGSAPAVAAVLPMAARRAARLEPSSAGALPRRRPAARSLLGAGQDLRRAIVAMTVLGPCRAQAPPESR
ncbi:MAG TPA: hypothetical protein DEH78_29765 [Solibacterales bacterium]|nr:hypothetical protein [Bryobacterales bacterium]